MRHLTLLTFLVACDPTGVGGGSNDGWEPVVFVDEGDVCMAQQGSDVAVTVSVQECLSSSCDRDLGGECAATVDGDTITLTSEIRWETDTDPEACTDDCGLPSVDCTIPGLPDGTYTVIHGTETTTLTVPITGECDPWM